MLRRSVLAVSFAMLALVACSKKKDAPPSGTGSGSAMAGSGSDSMAGSGSAMAGSGSDSMAGSGSAMAGSASDGSAAGSGTDAGSAAAGSGSDAPVEFEKLSHDDKVKFMKTKVMPVMKAAFQKFDAKEYANFGCKTCHGKDPQKSKYEMPTPDLPKLDWAKIKAGEDKEAVEFMEHTVKPEMAKILGLPEMTKDNPKGFACLNCHTDKK